MRCRTCKGSNIQEVLSLGSTPLANSFLRKDQLNSEEPSYPLKLCFCKDCSLVQLSEVVSPEILFRNYVYASSTTSSFRAHFASYAKTLTNRFNLSSNSLAVDIGSNDGILLKPLKELGVRILGVEPAVNIAKIANETGIETVNDFFSETLAKKIVKEKGKASVITASNVFAHVNNLDDLILGVKTLLRNKGAFIIEVPYLVDLIEKMYFDTVYHEHLSYFSVRPLITIFKRFGMEIFDIERIGTHGGSIRVYTSKKKDYPVSKAVYTLLSLEEKMKLNSVETYLTFASKVELLKNKLLFLLKQLRADGGRIVGYGAPAKGNTLLNYCKIGRETLDYIVDNSPLKQGLYTPGMHIPVVPVERIIEDKPDYVLILAWNFAEDIIRQEQEYRDLGGKFIIPVPEPKIV